MVFFVVRLSHYCEFKVEHAFPNQSFPRPLLNYHHVLPGAWAAPTLLTLFQFQSLSVDVLMSLLKRKQYWGIFHTFSHQKIRKNDPLSLDPYNFDQKNQAKLLVTVTVELVLYLDLWAKCSSFIFVLISNTISIAERYI